MFPKNTRILIADNSPAARGLLAASFCELGFARVDAAAGAQEGADRILAAEREGDAYGLAVFDWDMPNMDGLRLLKFVRMASGNPDLPILTAVAEADPDSILAAVKAGVDGYVLKPVKAAALEGKLKALWDHLRAAA